MGTVLAAVIGLIGVAISAAVAYNSNAQNNATQQSVSQQNVGIAKEQLEQNQIASEGNLALQKDQFEYQKYLNELQMRREDTAMQRQVADLKAAGLSPLMASGGAATGSYLSASAPQKDMSGINSALSNLIGANQDYATRKQNAYMFQRQQHMQFAQMATDLSSKVLDNRYKQAMIEGQQIQNAYNAKHGLRDPSLQNYLVDLLENYINSRNIDLNGVVDDKIDTAKQVFGDVKEKVSSAPKVMAENAKKTGNIITDTLVDSAKAIENVYKGSAEKTSDWFHNSYIYKKYMQIRKENLRKKAQKQFNKAAANW